MNEQFSAGLRPGSGHPKAGSFSISFRRGDQ
jgi:hypothetical protein